MSKGRSEPLQHVLLVYDAAGAKINGTGSHDDLNPSCRLAESILRIVPQAMRIDVHRVVDGEMQPGPVTSVQRESERA